MGDGSARSMGLRRTMRGVASVICGLCALLAAFASQAARPETTLPAVEPRFVRFGPEHGLPMYINDLAVDRQGYVWLATSDGLARYDGERFRFWRHEVGVDTSLPDNDLISLAIDGEDRVWVISSDYLSVLDRERRFFKKIVFSDENSQCGKEVTAVSAGNDGVIISSYSGVICELDMVGRVRLTVVTSKKSSVSAVPTALTYISPGEWLVGTDVGLWRRRGGLLIELAPEVLGRAQVFSITNGDDGGLWIGTDRGLFFVDSSENIMRSPWRLPPLSDNAIVRRDAVGGYWIGTAIGLFHANSRAHSPVLLHGGKESNGLSSGVFAMVFDNEGGIWAASYSQGISFLPINKGRFSVIDEIGGQPAEQADMAATVEDGNGGFWVVGSRMLYKISSYKKELKPIASADSLGVEWFQSIAKCDDGRVWIQSFESLLEFDAKNYVGLRDIDFPDDGSRTPRSVYCDRHGRLWVSFFGGAIRVYGRDGILFRDISPELTIGASERDYAKLQLGPDGEPWLSDGRVLRRWDGARFVPVPISSGEGVDAFAITPANDLWLARAGAIERYAWQAGRLVFKARLGEGDLPAVRVSGILAAGDRHLWLSTTRGLIQYDIEAKRARSYGPHDGLPDIDYSIDAPQRGASGPALAISKHGLVLFDPERPLPEPRASPLAIEAIELRRGEDTVAFDRTGADGVGVTMRPGDRDLRVVARVMSFVDPAAHRYRFRLRGYDPDWVMQGDRGERVFSSLPPGDYRLEIQGANADGVWSPTQRISLVVEAPWWRRWWALLLYAFIASALVWWLAYLDRMRLKRRHEYQLIRQKRELAEAASEAKSRFVANLGHEVRTPMTGVLGMSELLLTTRLDDRQQGQVWAIRRAGEHLLRLVNDALDLARIEAGRFELDAVDFPLDALVDEVAELMRPLAERKGVRFAVVVAEEARGGWCGDPTRVRQILLNLLGNAVKFTARGEVSLSIEPLLPQGLRCIVRDTGPGLDAEQQQRLFRRFEQAEGARTASRYGGSGLGLAICEELAVAMGGGIDVSSVPGEGACFVVRLPIERAVRPLSSPAVAGTREAVPRNVLLVEDDAIVADVIIGLLQAQSHRASHVGHALAALTANATQRFDLALIDLDLPGMDGLALARQLRAQGFDRPMIAITARADAEAEPQAMDAGFDAFLRKPLTGELLAEAIAGQSSPSPTDG
ncbi:sensor histidine kinase [Lysobacter hankyongensis]|uniref:sensor histidine kinase n=1 Tax=Lysobacter hankyongensis TaxID=1176535 RepID=UPI0031F0AD89